MSLTPVFNGITIGDSTEVETVASQPTRTYKIDFQTMRINGYVDENDAIKQAIYKILQSERFIYLIYSWNYGVETTLIMGQNNVDVESELKRIITEALVADERIIELTDFKITKRSKRTAAVEFTAVSIFGSISIREEVSI